jgi:maltooligosyltrehalose synthase
MYVLDHSITMQTMRVLFIQIHESMSIKSCLKHVYLFRRLGITHTYWSPLGAQLMHIATHVNQLSTYTWTD